MMTKSISDLAHEVGLVLFVDSEGHCVGVTDERLIPKAVYHNDERLNKLLAPFAAAVIAQYRESLLAGVGEVEAWKYTHIQSGYTDIRLEAPEQMNEWNDMQLWNVEPLYTADQMAAAVAIERERCAKVCDVTALTHEQGDDAATGSYRCAAAIRGQT